MRLLLLLLAICAGVQANYRLMKFYSGSNGCAEAFLGRMYAEGGSNCTLGETKPCHAGGGTTFKTSHKEECVAEIPMPEEYVITRSYETPDCSGEAKHYDIKKLFQCSAYEMYSCSGGVLTQTRYETIDCSSVAGAFKATSNVGQCNGISETESSLTTCS